MIPRSPASPSPQSSDRPRDEKIRSFTIILKDAAGNLGEEISLWQMFQRYDQKTHTLVQLAPPQDDKPAICQLLTLSDYYKQQVRTPRRERNPASVLKQLEMSWSIDPHDLRLRLDKLQDFLAAGHRVELTLATKKRTAPIAPQKAQEVMAAIEARIEEIEGAHEGRPRFGTLGRYMVLVLEGKKIGGPKSRPERRERRPPKPQRDRAEYLSEEQLAKLKG